MALRGALTHRKTRRLARLLNIEVPCALGVMEALWHVTATHAPTGAIGALSDQDIADEMFWTRDAGELVRALVEAELLDEDAVHRLIVHDWSEHADQSVRRKLVRNELAMASATTDPALNSEPRLVMTSQQLDATSYDQSDLDSRARAVRCPVSGVRCPVPESPPTPPGGSELAPAREEPPPRAGETRGTAEPERQIYPAPGGAPPERSPRRGPKLTAAEKLAALRATFAAQDAAQRGREERR